MKILSLEWSTDITIVPIFERWYRVPHEVVIWMKTNCGTYEFKVNKDFYFDGRSGPKLVDFIGIAPNLGTQAEIKAWFLHDILAYDVGLSFDETNYALYFALRNYCNYSWFRAKLIHKAVGLSDYWFGEPLKEEREYVNLGKINGSLLPKV